MASYSIYALLRGYSTCCTANPDLGSVGTRKNERPVRTSHSPSAISETDTFELGVTDVVRVENLFRRLREPMPSPWDVFELSRQLYADSYTYDKSNEEPTVTSVRAVSPERVESVFYKMKVS